MDTRLHDARSVLCTLGYSKTGQCNEGASHRGLSHQHAEKEIIRKD